jgi:hypothetical protein
MVRSRLWTLLLAASGLAVAVSMPALAQEGAGEPEQESQAGGQQPSPSAKEQIPTQTMEGQQSEDVEQGQARTRRDQGGTDAGQSQKPRESQ